MAPPIEVKCMGCGKSLKVQAKFAGKKGKCPVCSKVITIPDPENGPVSLGVNKDVGDAAIKAVAHSIAMGPGGTQDTKKKGFFAKLFKR